MVTNRIKKKQEEKIFTKLNYNIDIYMNQRNKKSLYTCAQKYRLTFYIFLVFDLKSAYFGVFWGDKMQFGPNEDVFQVFSSLVFRLFLFLVSYCHHSHYWTHP